MQFSAASSGWAGDVAQGATQVKRCALRVLDRAFSHGTTRGQARVSAAMEATAFDADVRPRPRKRRLRACGYRAVPAMRWCGVAAAICSINSKPTRRGVSAPRLVDHAEDLCYLLQDLLLVRRLQLITKSV